ncbi:hypothetical protein MARBORIA2_14360 [Methanobrevibacter arboriphilus]|uniref:Uncharacterized protein n=2 Tax=Methanobrevibacter arboriphilus TaxID=39441 RepID=A0ACA8R1W2_METAZ|nr:right-handed parallel beta-helix repeat-containing protein [Methanobrevibacter arboriphilus]MCC7562403.1 right-handed parallel beta-helix repeat-containing protein [Methanobrevibacter arboriphilus]BBL61565.1 hypothetical protein MarbSA_06050 [Methanobrevibacter arboriphilus]GLI12346.1 hypothetical protein MARBORIA2_14360 [Methanobrevibacter arboriphilus]
MFKIKTKKIILLGAIFSILLISSPLGFNTIYGANNTWIIDVEDKGMPGNMEYIQGIIDNASSGDTILFKGSEYTHLANIIVNKTLNIVSDVGTVLNSCNNHPEEPIFRILSGGSGTKIEGFNINAKEAGIIIDNATNVKIGSNNITAEGIAITILDSLNTVITNNRINNSGTGISSNNSNNTVIKNNTITNNDEGIISTGNTNNTEISYNNISNNNGFGVYFNNNGELQDNIKVLYNYIENQGQSGVYINSSYNILSIISNMITNNQKNGIYMDSGTNTSGQPTIEYNYLLYNTGFNTFQIQRVQTDDQHRAVLVIGYNFYGTNDRSGVSVCSKTTTGIILIKLSEISKGIFQIAYTTNDTGKIIKEMIPNYVKVNLNNNSQYQYVLIKNGTGIADFREYNYSSTGNEIYTYFLTKTALSINDNNIPQKSISINSKISSPTIKTGQTTKYTITVSNIGQKIIKSINIKNMIPNFAIKSFNTNIGSFNKNNKIWTVNSLKANEKAILNVYITPNKAGTFKNTATLTGDSFNKKSSLTSLKVNPAVEVKNSNKINTKKIRKNKYVTAYTTIKNYGTSSKNIKVRISPSKGLKTYNVNYKTKYSKKTNKWIVKLPAKKSVTLKMKLKGTSKGTKKVAFNVNGKKQNKYVKVV